MAMRIKGSLLRDKNIPGRGWGLFDLAATKSKGLRVKG
jgi:hypothetical protein